MQAADVKRDSINNILPLSLIFLVALVTRVILFWQDKVIAADGISYVNIARTIFQNADFSVASHFPPLYPLLIGLFSYITPYDEVAGKVVSTIMGSLLVFPVYLLGKELFSKSTGYIAAILASLSPTLIAISGIVLSQSTYITLFVTALYFCWRSFRTNSPKLALGAGIFFGAAYLTRPEAVVVLVGISAILLVFRSADLSLKDNLRLLGFMWGTFFLLAFPYILLMHKVFGTWQLTGKSSVTLADSLGWYLKRPDLKREPGFAGLTYLDVIKQYPDFLWKNPIRNLPTTWAELRPHMWFFALLGAISLFFTAEEKWKKLLFIGASLTPLVIIIVFFWIDAHYFSPCLPIMYILGGEGLRNIEKGMRTALSGVSLPKLCDAAPWGIIIGSVLALSAILPSLVADRSAPYHFTQDGARYDHKLIGLMLKKHLPPKSKVMVKSGRIAFYGDFQHVDIPQTNLPEILLAAKTGKARYLIADGTLFDARPQLEPFLNPLLIPQDEIFTTGPFDQMPDFPGGLRLVLVYKSLPSVGVAVYEIPG